MAEAPSRPSYTAQEVAALMYDDEDHGDPSYPGSDDELGFEEVEIGGYSDEESGEFDSDDLPMNVSEDERENLSQDEHSSM